MLRRLPKSSNLIFLAICLLALWLRTFNVNWDQFQHLHPDERFLTMVMGNMITPPTLAQYLDPNVSTFNPVNIGHAFYVYGTFPLVVNKLAAQVFDNDNYNELTIQGRWFSSIADVVTVAALMLFVKSIEQRHKLSAQLAYLSGFLYAIAVLPIQQSHFFTTDTFALAFFMVSLWAASRTHQSRQVGGWVLLSAVAFGLSLASKVNAILGLPLVCWFLFDPLTILSLFKKKKLFSLHALLSSLMVCIWFILAWITVRFADPYYFAKFSLVDIQINPAFIKNIETLQTFSDREGFFPPAIQWMSKTPLIFPLVNIAVFGLGLPIFVLVMYGIGSLIRPSVFKSNTERVNLVIILLWMLAFSLYQGLQFVSTMRYFLFLYPFFALLAAVGIVELAKRLVPKLKMSKNSLRSVYVLGLLGCSLWTIMYMSVFMQENSRVRASRWMYSVLPDNSVIAVEHWDDPIPLQIEGANPDGKKIEGEQLPVFYPDTEEKWKEMEEILNKVDYYVITSNRGWGSIMSVPEKYPRMTAFYQDLFEGQTDFEKIAEFTSYPSVSYLGIPLSINDDWSEEAFTVYDHPKVMIFSKVK